MPNKFVSTLSGLLDTAKVELKLVEEIAADIFMGGFVNKFVEQARKVLQDL